MRYLELSKEGKVKTFKGDFELLLKEKKETRVSRIVPENIFLRIFFLLLRRVFGDEGKVADWTRRWSCRWVLLVGGEKLGVFKDRKEAIEFEKKFISRR
ncbi:MAG: hypothetical protein QW212_00210 [Nitrososphaerales archaeon]